MNKRRIEAELSDSFSKLETKVYGKGPQYIKTLIIQDLVIVRLGNFVSFAEKKLLERKGGIKQLKDYKSQQFEIVKPYHKKIIKDITWCNIVSSHYELSTKTGETMIVFVASENLEKKINNMI